jgi:hypothetical protein
MAEPLPMSFSHMVQSCRRLDRAGPVTVTLFKWFRADDALKGKESKVDYERKAVQIVKNAREAILFRWNYEFPGQDQT